MPSSSTVRVAISGFGRLAREYYVPILKDMAGVALVAVADSLDQSRRAATERLPDLRTYVDACEMCGKEDLHAVLVASPPSSHLEAWRAAHERGIATFIEKPLGLISQLASLPQLSDADARLMMNFNRRFWPAYARFAEAVTAGRLGELQSVELILQTNVRKWSTVTQHRLSAGEGGVLHDLGSQAIDVVCQVAGKQPSSVSAQCTVRSGHEQVELQMQFANSARAHCTLAYGTNNRESLLVVGSDASMILREPNMEPHMVGRGSRLRVHHHLEDLAALGYRFFVPRERMLHYTMTKALAQFIDALRTGRQQCPGYSEGLANLRLLARAAETMQAPAQVTHG